MSSGLRYFPNPYAATKLIANYSNPENEIKKFLWNLISNIQKNVQPRDIIPGAGLYLSTTGISYMFYHLSENTLMNEKRDDYLNNAEEYIKPALEKINREKPYFILGSAGVYAVATAVYHAKGDHDQFHKYGQIFNQISEYFKQPDVSNCGADELFVGRAGYIMGALWLSKKTQTPLQIHDIYELCNIIIKSGKDYALKHQTQSPLMYSYYDVEYLGAAHGLSSILQCILSVPGYLNENPENMHIVKESVDYLLSLQTDGNFPASTDEIGYEAKLVHWCHGAPGVFYLMAKAYLVFKDAKYLESCEKMCDLIWRNGLLKKGPGLCHGVSGNGYAFLIMYRLTGNQDYFRRAIYFYKFMDTDTFKNNSRAPDNPYSLYEGIAGTVCFLGDLLFPENASFPFSDIF
ncbi:lanC-like protein 3 isoform X1 [Rhynchophorus ferrugineus]|uniref:lanC-like protein 3 isoform X1 n=1 Tax=Rhynchophorus ferrugineus TaxID=354439 RepID=UPI003FCD62B1